MIWQVYSVFDSAVKVFDRPFLQKTRGEATRSWVDVCNNKESKMFMHPQDFALFQVASYDDETGRYSNLQVPDPVGLAIEFVEKVSPQLRAASAE